MSRTSTHNNSHMSASSPPGGGVFTLFILPIFFICILFFGLTGHTSSPLTLQADLAAQAEGDMQELIAPLFTDEVQYWARSIVRWAGNYDLDPNLVATVMQIESCGDPLALSGAGAQGLFQVMPFHFQSGDQMLNPDTNALRGLAYLRDSLNHAGDERLALAGYNGGISTAGRAEHTWPAETVRYAYWGSGIYKDASRDKSSSPVLNEWLNAGGASLCAQAAERLGLAP